VSEFLFLEGEQDSANIFITLNITLLI
jgi:hypothetical protein